ncbi:MAG: DUF2073 domain-containing protein [Candidatus Woesearchaeota archaeon]
MLTLQFVPYHEISPLTSAERVDKLLDIVKKNKIVLMQGKLKPSEETSLIQKTMENVSKDFKGIELCTISSEKAERNVVQQMKSALAKVLLGGNEGITIIGPASIVKEIKRNPDKIELLTKPGRK